MPPLINLDVLLKTGIKITIAYLDILLLVDLELLGLHDEDSICICPRPNMVLTGGHFVCPRERMVSVSMAKVIIH
jgi:hypothetical protein